MASTNHPYGASYAGGGNPIGNSGTVTAMQHSTPPANYFRWQIDWRNIENPVSTTLATAVTTTGSQTVTVNAWLAGFANGNQILFGTSKHGEYITITGSNQANKTITATFGQTHLVGDPVSAAQPGDNPLSSPSTVLPYDWSLIDDLVTVSQANGFHIIFPIQSAPPWHQEPLSSDATRGVPVPADAAFFLKQLLLHTGPGIFFSIEANNEGFGGSSVDLGQFTNQMIPTLQQMRPIVEQYSPGTLFGAPAELDNTITNATQWWNNFYSTGAYTYVDYGNIHFYPGGDPDTAGAGKCTFLQRLSIITQAQTNNNAPHSLPIWLTEWGWTRLNSAGTNGGVPDATLATYITKLLTEAMNSGMMQRVTYFNLGDIAPGTGSTQNFSTLAFQAWANFINQHPTWGPSGGQPNLATKSLALRTRIRTRVPSTIGLRILIGAAKSVKSLPFRLIVRNQGTATIGLHIQIGTTAPPAPPPPVLPSGSSLSVNQSTGTNGILSYPGFKRQDMYVEIDLSLSDSGGPLARMVDAADAYFLSIADGSAVHSPNTIQIKKMVAGVISNVGTSIPISFVRGDYHRFRLDIQGSTLSAYMDGAQLLSAADSTITAAGTAGLFAGSHTGDQLIVYSLRIQPYGDVQTGKSLYTRVRLATTDPTVTPQLQGMTVSVRNPNIGDGVLVPSTNYAAIGSQMMQVAQALDDVAKRSNYAWYIGNQGADNKQFFFHARTARPAPFYLYSGGSGAPNGTGGNILASTHPKVSHPDMLYRNRMTIDGGIDTTTTITYILPADGLTQTWPLAYPVNATPVITVDGQLQTLGVSGVDTGKQFYYKIGSNVITQDASQTPPLKSDVPTIQYVGQIPVRVTVDNTNGTGIFAGTTGQAQLALIDGTSGIVEDYQQNPGINKAAATQLATSLLIQYGRLGTTLTILTNQYGLAVGQVANVTLEEHGIFNQPYLITKITTTCAITTPGANANVVGNLLYTFQVELTTGPILGSWEIFFGKAFQGSTV